MGEGPRESSVGKRSAPTAASKELGALELVRLEPATACGSSSWELLWLRVSL